MMKLTEKMVKMKELVEKWVKQKNTDFKGPVLYTIYERKGFVTDFDNAEYAVINVYDGDDFAHYRVQEALNLDEGHDKDILSRIRKIAKLLDGLASEDDLEEYLDYDIWISYYATYDVPYSNGAYHFLTREAAEKYLGEELEHKSNLELSIVEGTFYHDADARQLMELVSEKE